MKTQQDAYSLPIEIFLDKDNANLFNAIRIKNDALFEQRINYPVDLSTIRAPSA